MACPAIRKIEGLEQAIDNLLSRIQPLTVAGEMEKEGVGGNTYRCEPRASDAGKTGNYHSTESRLSRSAAHAFAFVRSVNSFVASWFGRNKYWTQNAG